MVDNRSVASLLKGQREKRRLTQKKAAELVGIDCTYYNKLEKGKIKRPRDETLNKLRALWPEVGPASRAQLSALPDAFSLDEFLDKLWSILKRGEIARLRPELLPMADWVRWLHHALLELQDRYGAPPER